MAPASIEPHRAHRNTSVNAIMFIFFGSRGRRGSMGSLRVIAHRVRQQLGVCLREVIADTVESPEAVDEELRHLQQVLARRW